jgi:hypothetical protein
VPEAAGPDLKGRLVHERLAGRIRRRAVRLERAGARAST